MSLRKRIFDMLDATASLGRSEALVSTFLFTLIVVNVVAVLLASVRPVAARWGTAFWRLEVFSVAVFTVEYLLRLWSAPEHPSGRYTGVRGRLRFMFTPLALVDLLAILPFYTAFLLPSYDLRFLRVLRLVRMLKLMRYSRSMDLLAAVVREERNSLLTALIIMLLLLVLASSLMYLVEGDYQPDDFGSIPQAMWWGMVTLTTLGYGDVVPQTTLGKALGMVIALIGVGTFALPTGILASGFLEQMKKRDFLTMWHIVAALPLFRGLTATQISEVMQWLQARPLQRNEILFRAGDSAAGMYFIVSGQVEVEFPDGRRKRLSQGDFVGEIALLRDVERTATVRGVAKSLLMFLERDDLLAVLQTHPEIGALVEQESRRRLEELEATQSD